MDILTTEHQCWNEFVDRLAGPDGCDFRRKDGKTVWKCDGSTDKPLARAILATIPNIDIEKTLEYFESHGGHCDCEVLFNVDR